MARLTGVSLPGGWLYASIILGAVICGISELFVNCAIWQWVALVFASWLLLVGEVLMLGAFLLSRSGLKGIQ